MDDGLDAARGIALGMLLSLVLYLLGNLALDSLMEI